MHLRTLLLTFVLAAVAHAEPAFKVTIDTSKAPECEPFAAKSKTLVEEWYPKINEILFGKDHPLPSPDVSLIFEPMKGVAATSKNVIRISAEWVTKKAPNDYGMVIHELTHIVQDYRGKGEGWLTEGIADYIRDHHFETRQHRIDPEKSSYRQGYGIAAAFLIWLEEKKHPGLVRKLNVASNDGTYRRELFTELCGADVDVLWKEFVATLPRS
jgi:Peptidase of plants and bacteria